MAKAGPPVLWIKTRVNGVSVLRAANAVAEGLLAKMKDGTILRAKPSMPRNVKHSNKYWAMIGLIGENLQQPIPKDVLSDYIKKGIGAVDIYWVGGKMVEYPKSIAFDAMDQNDFSEFYERCLDFIVADLLPMMDRGAIRNEVEEMIGI